MRYLRHFPTVAGILMLATLAHAGDKQDDKAGHAGMPSHCCRFVKCPQCCHDCVFSAEKAKETKSCYDVECKPICIPKVTFPWQKGCCCCDKDGDKDGCCAVHNGAKKRSVRVLKKYEYECPHCKYQWTPVSDKDDWRHSDVKDKTSAPEPTPADDATVPPSAPATASRTGV